LYFGYGEQLATKSALPIERTATPPADELPEDFALGPTQGPAVARRCRRSWVRP
jgi:hypothetical protein